MNSGSEIMREIREEQITRGMKYFVVFLIFILTASLSRKSYFGWNNHMFIHIGYFLIMLGITVFNKFIPYIVKVIIILCTTFLLGAAGLSYLGLAGFGMAGFFIFCLLSTILFGSKGGITALILSTITITVIGLTIIKGTVSYDFDIIKYLSSYNAWATGIIGMIVITGLVVISITTINNKLLELVGTLNIKNQQLKEANENLKKALDEKSKLKAGLEQAQKMELVGTLVGEVAHDLNNVLSASINYPEMLLDQIPKSSPFREPIEVIKKSGIKASAMVQDFLTLARRRVPVEEVVNINQIVSECIASPEIEKIKIYHPGVEIEVKLEENLWNNLGSPIHLGRALINLISNAAEAISGRGKIIIETRNLVAREFFHVFEKVEPGEYTVLIVSDTGIGISEEDTERIFEPFYTKKVMGRSGTGLGMAVVWNAVKDHKGFINVQSIENRGTTFTLYFPKTERALEQVKPKAPTRKFIGRGERILVVDDLEEQRKIADKILSDLGYSVSTASSGEQAVDYLKRISFDLVILDMIMPPGIDGLETYKQIIQCNRKQKVLIVSGFSKTERVKKALELGARQFIKKPYLKDVVAFAVRTELDRDTIDDSCYH